MLRTEGALQLALFACLVFFLTACEPAEQEGKETAISWEAKLNQALPALGHRNWIVIVDSAYPAQVSPGINLMVAGEDHFSVLEKVLRAVDGSKHIRPRIYLDKELAYVTEDLAPGIEACRTRLGTMLTGHAVTPIPHEDLIARLDEVAKTFRVLMIKTTLTLPYTSVFMELDCGYWTPEAETKMRESMK